MKNPPYYLEITPFFPTAECFRGPFIYDQAKAIAASGEYRVVVLKPVPFYLPAEDYTYEGVPVHRFRNWGIPCGILPDRFSRWSQHALRRKLSLLGISLSEIAVVHAHTAGLAHFANFLKRKQPSIKTILQHHGFDVFGISNGRFSKYAWHRKYVARAMRDECNRIDCHVGVSQAALDELLRQPGMTPRQCRVLYNGVDPKKFHPLAGKRDSRFFTIGCIGNFWPLKDQMTLIKAAEKLVGDGMKDLRVLMIGTGQTREPCEKYVCQGHLQDHIFFQNEVAHTALIDFYNQLDLFVLPSYWEAFGCVYTEAYACGVPFIGCRGQGIAEMLSPAEAERWLIDKGDDAGLAELIRRYREERYRQTLIHPYLIDDLIHEFCERIHG